MLPLLVPVHVLHFAADVGFVSLNLARRLFNWPFLHGQPNPVQHEPCGFLCHADSAMDLVRTDTVFRVGEHPQRRKPFVERKGAILEDRADADGKLLFLLTLIALPDFARGKKGYVLAAAARALNAIGPT